MTPQPVIDFVKLPERYTPYTEKKLDDDAKLWAKILSQKAFDLAEVIYKEEKQ